MLERPDLQDQHIISRLQEEFGLQVRKLTFLPLGVDVNAAVFRVITLDQMTYFLKLRRGDFNEISVLLPHFLNAQGIQAIIAPLKTTKHADWTDLEAYKMVLYTFVEGKDGYETALSDQQWRAFGVALKGIHTAQVPLAISSLIPQETYSSNWREMVRAFQAQVEEFDFDEPTAAKLAIFMKEKRREISHLVRRADELAHALRSQSPDHILCHYDIHAGNLLLGANDALYIVDWDNPIYAPKERDLILIGGSAIWNNEREEVLFYEGYGQTEIDRTALAYYRYERIIQDIAEFCKQLFLTSEGGDDREQAYQYFTSQFLPEHEVEIAFKTGLLLKSQKH